MPGAKMSTTSPQLEKDDFWSDDVDAPTVHTLGSDAGEWLAASELSLPAATARNTPDPIMAAAAGLMAAE